MMMLLMEEPWNVNEFSVYLYDVIALGRPGFIFLLLRVVGERKSHSANMACRMVARAVDS
jgi:hypothetical protein